jgi:hypothetical protein
MALSSSSIALAAVLGSPPSTKLTRANFLFWKTLVLPPLRGAQVLELLEGTDTAPEKFFEVEDSEKKKTRQPNPAYAAWLSRDQTVLGWLLQTLSPEVIAHVVGIDSSAGLWAVLTTMFSGCSRSKLNELRGALTSTKKNDLTPAAYFAKMESFASELAAAGKPVDEDEMVGYIVNGLDASYNDVAANINGNADTTLDDLYDQVCAHDRRQDMLSSTGQEAGSGFTSSANVASRHRDTDRDYRTRGDRGKSPEYYHQPRGDHARSSDHCRDGSKWEDRPRR